MARRILTIALVGVSLALTVVMPSAALGTVFHLPANAGENPYLDGKLTWNGDNRKITWGSNIASEDNVPAAPSGETRAVDDATWRADQHLFGDQAACTVASYAAILDGTAADKCSSPTYGYTSGLATSPALPGPFTFETEPLPRALYVNVTRGLQLELFLQKNPEAGDFTPCGRPPSSFGRDPMRDTLASDVSTITWTEPLLYVEVSMGGTLLGGAYGEDTVSYSYDPTIPKSYFPAAPPAGYGTCYFPMHSEVRVIPANTVLTVTIRHGMQRYWYPYGLAGTHHSTFRIWEYPLEELVFRYPDLAQQWLGTPVPGDESSDGSGQFSMASGLPMAAGLALAAPLASRRRGAALRVAALVAALALAGCLDGAGPGGHTDGTTPYSGAITNEFVPTSTLDGGNGTSAGTGAMLGEVHDDLEIAIPNVHVSVLGRSGFDVTDSQGRFRFFDVPPGTYTLRFEHTEYKTLQGPVEVKAGFVSRPGVQLDLLNPKARDFRPHPHNEWGGAAEKPLGTWQVDPVCPGDPTKPCHWPESFTTVPSANDPHTILMGTMDVVLTMTWNAADSGVERMGLSIDRPWGGFSWSYAPRTSGTTYHIQTTWEMSDVSHALASAWTFHLRVPVGEGAAFQDQRGTHTPGHDPGPITVTGKIIRGGKIPLEKAHKDWWNGATKLDVLKAAPFTHAFTGAAPADTTGCPTGTLGAPMAGGPCRRAEYTVSGLIHPPIPPDTQYVEAKVTATRAPIAPFDIKLYLKPANVPSYTANPQTLAGYTGVDMQPGGTWEGYTFRLTLKTGEADYVYNPWSLWSLTYRVTDENNAYVDYMDALAQGRTPSPTSPGLLSYTITLTAHKAPAS